MGVVPESHHYSVLRFSSIMCHPLHVTLKTKDLLLNSLLLFFFTSVADFKMTLAYNLFFACIIFAWIVSQGKQERKVLQQEKREASPTTCEEGSYVLNQCEERCKCKHGKLTNCYRVRKDFTKMDIEERKRFINTYKMASLHPLFKKDYENVVAFHINAPDKLLHHTPKIFFPWHRWFLVQFENLLRRIDCRVTAPYWDWSRVAHHWWRGSGNRDLWNSGEHGVGRRWKFVRSLR